MTKVSDNALVNFTSNNYLGLAHHPKVAAATTRTIAQCGIRLSGARLKRYHHLVLSHLLVKLFCHYCKVHNIPITNSITPIQNIPIGDALKVLEIREYLLQKGFWVAAIVSPTVPKKQECLRISITAKHTKEMLAELVLYLQEALGFVTDAC